MADGCLSDFCRRRTVLNSWMHEMRTQINWQLSCCVNSITACRMFTLRVRVYLIAINAINSQEPDRYSISGAGTDIRKFEKMYALVNKYFIHIYLCISIFGYIKVQPGPHFSDQTQPIEL